MQILECGGVVAVPTDTVYGLVTTIPNAKKIYALKRRNPLKPFGLFINDINEVSK